MSRATLRLSMWSKTGPVRLRHVSANARCASTARANWAAVAGTAGTPPG